MRRTQPVEHLVVLQQRTVALAARDEDDVRIGDLVEREVGADAEPPGVGALGAGLLGDEVKLGLG